MNLGFSYLTMYGKCIMVPISMRVCGIIFNNRRYGVHACVSDIHICIFVFS